ncbi:MAG TPA: hypothetical protein DF603_08730, partial [Chryseobacterium sp.]|nr:hypothetical protein [Chryseobacterium sp.]
HNNLTKSVTTFPDKTIQETGYQYAHEKGNQLMVDKNMIGIPLETITKQTMGSNTKILSREETTYPTSIGTPQAGNLVLPLSEKSYDVLNTNTSYTDVTYDQYDDKGNILQYTMKDGTPVTILWGYNQTLPIAKIEGMTYGQVSASGAVTAIVAASNDDGADPSKENILLTALSTFRKHQTMVGRKVTTYTHDPLIGVTSITQPSGIREVFSYDMFGRLKETGVNGKNSSGVYIKKKTKEFKYNYKQ